MAAQDIKCSGKFFTNLNVSSEDNKINNSISPNVNLFRAVISQAVIDVLSNNPKLLQEKHEAKRWLFYSDKDFSQICDMAELDQQYTREKIRKFLNER